jgi:hypothetical protein
LTLCQLLRGLQPFGVDREPRFTAFTSCLHDGNGVRPKRLRIDSNQVEEVLLPKVCLKRSRGKDGVEAGNQSPGIVSTKSDVDLLQIATRGQRQWFQEFLETKALVTKMGRF